MTLATLGAACGLVAAFLVTRLMAAMLFGVSATDPVTFLAVPAVLLLVMGIACVAAWSGEQQEFREFGPSWGDLTFMKPRGRWFGRSFDFTILVSRFPACWNVFAEHIRASKSAR